MTGGGHVAGGGRGHCPWRGPFPKARGRPEQALDVGGAGAVGRGPRACCKKVPLASCSWPCSAPTGPSCLSSLQNHLLCMSACPVGCQCQRERQRETEREGDREGERREEGKEWKYLAWVWGAPVRRGRSHQGWKHRPTYVWESRLGRSGEDGASGLSAGAWGADNLPDPPSKSLEGLSTWW